MTEWKRVERARPNEREHERDGANTLAREGAMEDRKNKVESEREWEKARAIEGGMGAKGQKEERESARARKRDR